MHNLVVIGGLVENGNSVAYLCAYLDSKANDVTTVKILVLVSYYVVNY